MDRWLRTLSLLACCLAAFLPDAAAAAPARTLTFLGIFEDGRPLERVESAVRRRLELLEVAVQQPPVRSRCQAAECMPTAVPGAPLILTGRVLRAPLGCITTIWLKPATAPAMEREISCGVEWSQEELGVAVTRELGLLMEAEGTQSIGPIRSASSTAVTKIEIDNSRKIKKWNRTRKISLIASSAAVLGTAVTFGILAGLHGNPSWTEGHRWNALTGMKTTGALLAIEAAGLVTLTIVPLP